MSLNNFRVTKVQHASCTGTRDSEESLNCWVNGVTTGGLMWPSFLGPFSEAQFESRIHEAI